MKKLIKSNKNYTKQYTKKAINTKKIKTLVFLISISSLFLLLTVYAWMSTQKNVSLNSLKGKIEVAEGLQISMDAEKWQQEIELGTVTRTSGLLSTIESVEADWSEYDLGVGEGITKNVRPTLSEDENGENIENSSNESTGYMEPVSTSGVIDDDEKNIKMFGGTLSGNTLKNISQKNEDENVGYYAFDIYLMNTTKAGIDFNQLQLNFDSVVEEIKSNSGTDYGLKNCVRVAFAKYDETVTTTAKKAEILEKMEDATIEQVAIWEHQFLK